MPIVSMTLPDTAQSISRPAVFDIIQQIQEITKITKESRIMFPGDAGIMQNPSSNMDSTDERLPIFQTNRYVHIEVTESTDEAGFTSMAVHRDEHIPVFTDAQLGVEVRPVYEKTNVSIAFRYESPSKSEAKRWYDDMVMRASQMRDVNLHDIRYHYYLPNEVLTVLEEVYSKREAYLGYGDSFEEYVLKYVDPRMTMVGDPIAKNVRLAITEKQMRIVGQFDFTGIPEKAEKDSDAGIWSVSFTYNLSFDRPVACTIRYPVMVHNQLLDGKFIEFHNKVYKVERVAKRFSASAHAMHAFEVETILANQFNTEAYIRIPEFDDYILPGVPGGTGTIFTGLVEVDQDCRTLLDLHELGDIGLDEDILWWIRNVEYPYMTKLYESIIYVHLYRNNYLVRDNSLICTPKGILQTKDPLNLRNQHRVRFALMADITKITAEAIERLKKCPKVFVKIISAINELLRDSPDFNNLGDKKRISEKDFNEVYKIITGYEYDNYNNRYNARCAPLGYSTPLLRDWDPVDIERYRNNVIRQNTVMLTSVCLMRKEN